MGFLDHSTNNIIVDAVLTDHGRRMLSQGGNSFAITKCAFGDDEVDYSIIKRFGRTVGKEKIEKNTPIFEAQTSGNTALKHRLMTIDGGATVKKMPFMTLGAGDSGLTYTTGQQVSRTITIQTLIPTQFGTSVNAVSARDSGVLIRVPSLFFGRPNAAGTGLTEVSSIRNTRSYQANLSMEGGGGRVLGRVTISLPIRTITTDTWNLYGLPSNRNQIVGVINVVGQTTGMSKAISFTITKGN